MPATPTANVFAGTRHRGRRKRPTRPPMRSAAPVTSDGGRCCSLVPRYASQLQRKRLASASAYAPRSVGPDDDTPRGLRKEVVRQVAHGARELPLALEEQDRT